MMTQNFSRRQMLATSVAGASALVWSRRLPAAESLRTVSFVIVSDTHLGRHGSTAAEKNWRKAIDEINLQPGQFVLHLGDIVDSAREEQYPVYVETRKLLKKPIYEIPGNHDSVELFKKFVHKDTDRAFDVDGVRFLLFNNSRRDSHDGFISDQQFRWLFKQWTDAKQQGLKVVICCHVPIHPNKNPDRGWYTKSAYAGFYKSQHFNPHVLACFHGHFHNGIRGWRNNDQLVETLCPSVCYNQNRGLKQHIANGRADGFFVDELRPGYVLAELGAGRLTLRYKPLGAEFNGQYAAEWR